MRAIVFDLDNTLYPYSPCDLAGRSAVFETLRGTVEISRERFESLYAECDRFTKKAHPKTAAGHNRLLFCHHLCEVLNLPADIYGSKRAAAPVTMRTNSPGDLFRPDSPYPTAHTAKAGAYGSVSKNRD